MRSTYWYGPIRSSSVHGDVFNLMPLVQSKNIAFGMDVEWPTSFTNYVNSSSRKSKKRRTENSTKSLQSNDQNIWLEKYAPTTFNDLAVHKKKREEVDAWISTSTAGRKSLAPVLLLTGPSGCGKTATLLVSARTHSIQVQEWINPLSVSFSLTKDAGLQYRNDSSKFEEFLFGSGKFPSLMFSEDPVFENKLILLEDLPYHLIREPEKFRDVLRQYRATARHPLVIILSDRSIPDSVRRNLLPPEIINQLGIHTICFNPVATTCMKKTLLKIASEEKCQISKEDLSSIINSSSGDIRAAINSMQFHLQKGSPTQLKVPSKNSNNTSISLDCGKDVSLLLFRALGKILYCKRDETKEQILPIHLQKFHRDPLLINPEEILEHCCLSGSSFSLYLQQNFIPFFTKIDDLSNALESLCHADIITTRQTAADYSDETTKILNEYEGSISSRAVAFHNSSRATEKQCKMATGKWRPLHKPAWYQVVRKRREIEYTSHRLFWNLNLPSQELLLNQLPYLNKIIGLSAGKVEKKNSSNYWQSLNPAQRDFLSEVVHFAKQKSVTYNSERIVDSEMGEEVVNNVEVQKSVPWVDEKAVEESDKFSDDDLRIEDFDDSDEFMFDFDF